MENTGYMLSVARIGDDRDRRICAVDLSGGETNTEVLRRVTGAVDNGDVYLAKARGNPYTRWLEADDEDLRELQRTFIPYELEEKYIVDQFEPTCTTMYFFKCLVLLVCLACIATGVALFANAKKTSETIYNDVGQLLAVTLSACGILSTLLLCKK